MENLNNTNMGHTYSLNDIVGKLSISFSTECNEVFDSFFQAMGEISGLKKDSNNTFFKSSYTSLDAIIVAIRKVLFDHGLLFTQNLFTFKDETSLNGSAGIESMIMHKSGQWIKYGVSTLPVIPGKGQTVLHAVGSATTYLRRYQVSAIFGITDSKYDCDGNNYGDGNNPQQYNHNYQAPQNTTPVTQEQIDNINAVAKAKNISEAQVMTYVSNTYKVGELSKLNVTQYEMLVQALQSAS